MSWGSWPDEPKGSNWHLSWQLHQACLWGTAFDHFDLQGTSLYGGGGREGKGEGTDIPRSASCGCWTDQRPLPPWRGFGTFLQGTVPGTWDYFGPV